MPNTSPSQKNIVYGTITAGGNVHIGDYLVTYNHYFAAQEVKIPHRLTNNIPTNADHILGRASELEQAKGYLAQHQATILFNGIGGIGKTALASKFMALYGHEYQHLAWITVQSTLAEAFTNNAPLLASLQITQQVQEYIGAKQLEKAFEYLFHQLNLLERTLVVIDNANDLDDLDQYKNWFDTANCHFLITSRNQPTEWASVEVDSLPEDEAVRLFRKLHPTVTADDSAIMDLLSKLYYHTLLIELVAKAGASIPFADLQNMIEAQFFHHESINEIPISTGKHGSAIPSNLKKAKIEDYIWLIFSQITSIEDNSKQLLKAMALLPVATPFDLDFLKKHFDFFNIPDAVVRLESLTEHGWLQKEQAEGLKLYFKMHPLIADVVVEHLEVDVAFAENFITLVSNYINYDTTNPSHNLLKKKGFMFLAERLSILFSQSDTILILVLLNNLSILEQEFGHYNNALRYVNRALEISEIVFKDNSKGNLGLNGRLGQVYISLGRYEEAKGIFEIAFLKCKDILGERHIQTTSIQSNLAVVYRYLRMYDDAIILLENILEWDIKELDKDSPNIAISQSNLAIVYTKVGRYKEAIDLLQTSLESDIKNFGKNHPNITFNLSSQAEIYWILKNHNKAIKFLEFALKNEVANYGEFHPNIAFIKNNIAHIYFDSGKREEALALW